MTTSTYAQNLRLRKIQNRQHGGQDIFNIGKRGEPIPGRLDPVTIARKARRVAKRSGNLKKRLGRLERELMAVEKDVSNTEAEIKKGNKKLQTVLNQATLAKSQLQQSIMLTHQSLAAVMGNQLTTQP